MRMHIKNRYNRFFIKVYTDDDIYVSDKDIARLFRLQENEYQHLLVKHCNGFMFEGQIFFKNYQHAEESLELLDSIHLINRLEE